jgi:hypothetical protein
VFEVRWLYFVRKQKWGQNYSGRIIVWNQDDKIIRGRNNRGTRKTLVLLWENHFTECYLQKSIRSWLYGEESGRFWAVGNLSQCLKKDICNVREIREDAASLSKKYFWKVRYNLILKLKLLATKANPASRNNKFLKILIR